MGNAVGYMQAISQGKKKKSIFIHIQANYKLNCSCVWANR